MRILFIVLVALFLVGCTQKNQQTYINLWQLDSVLFNGQKMISSGDYLQLKKENQYVFYQFGQRDEGRFAIKNDSLYLLSDKYKDRKALNFLITKLDTFNMQLQNTDRQNKMIFYLSAKK